jgi:transposase, IS5 family
VPLETYLRIMFLKFRYRLGDELLCREVADSISWQRFCRIPLGSLVPHPTTLVKLTRRLGEQTVAALNQALLHTAADHKVLRTHRVRADTTVVAAKVAYPTDAGQLARAIGKLASTIGRIQAAGGASRTRVRDRRRSARRRAHQLAKTLRARSEQPSSWCWAPPASWPTWPSWRSATLPGWPATPAASWSAPAPVVPGGWPGSSPTWTPPCSTPHIVAQTRIRLAGGTADGASRLVSLHDPDARPIVKGRLGKPVEFGDKAQVADNPDGVVLDDHIEVGNPADAPLLVPAVRRVTARAGRVPEAVTADRSYGEAAIDQALHALGVERVAIPRKGQAGAARRATEHTRGFRRLVKWRTGSEGRISHLKHRFGWDRTLMDGIDGARIWCGHGVLAHNLVKISGLIETKQAG